MRTIRMGACNCEQVGSAHVVKVGAFGIPAGFGVFFFGFRFVPEHQSEIPYIERLASDAERSTPFLSTFINLIASSACGQRSTYPWTAGGCRGQDVEHMQPRLEGT